MEAALIVFFALLGMTIASFLNVCIDRLPENESLIFPASHCSSCNHRLSVKDLIPVFSYLWLRGRCRYCQASIPRRILWVEIGTGVLFAFLYWYYGLTAELAVTAFFSSLLIVIMVIDLERGLILNKLVYPGIVIALIVSIFLPPYIAKAAIGGGIGFGIFILITLISRGGMGWGDVKLATLLGLITGFPLVFIALLLAIIFGGLVAIVLLLLKIRGRKEPIPFGPFLSLSIIVTMLWGNNILDWYLNLNLF
jgi:prepilin signal peptidase PulO-like enzyme (type II secretory pathway)